LIINEYFAKKKCKKKNIEKIKRAHGPNLGQKMMFFFILLVIFFHAFILGIAKLFFHIVLSSKALLKSFVIHSLASIIP